MSPSVSRAEKPLPVVGLIRGDGVGPEIAQATVRAVEAAGAHLRWEPLLAGAEAAEKRGDPLPVETLARLRQLPAALKGPLTTPVGGGWRSVNVTLRQELELYANVRPARSFAGVPAPVGGVDMVIVRENTEDLYAGIEHYVDLRRSAAEAVMIVTRAGSERVLRYAFAYARRHSRKRVTLLHKANILKKTSGLFLEVGREVAARHPEIEFRDMIIDAACMNMVMRPGQFDVVVTTNLFGDIVSDLAAGLVGGLGLAPGANIGERGALFEAVHGTAPDIAGRGIANPTALMLAASMMLAHLRQGAAARRLDGAVRAVLAEGRTVTPDLGGSATTEEYADAVIRRMAKGRRRGA